MIELVDATEFELRTYFHHLPEKGAILYMGHEAVQGSRDNVHNMVRRGAHVHCVTITHGVDGIALWKKWTKSASGRVLRIYDHKERRLLSADNCTLCQRRLDDAGFAKMITEFAL